MASDTTILPARYADPTLVARGGMGEIYRAVDRSLGREVAIKVLDERYAGDDVVRRRFTREAHAAARLSGEPGVVTIFDVGEWRERPFIVMEYLEGGSLQDVLRREGRQPPARVLRWLEQAGRALDRAHARGVVHRDVKPANLLLDRDGDVHVADFGVATAAGLATLTETGTVLGTAGYLAPEQAAGRPTTPATDRYALGVVAFELLTGERPFANESVAAEAAAHLNAPVPSISARVGAVPATADPVFTRALAKDPERRYPTGAAFVAALRDAFAADAGPTWTWMPPRSPRRRRLALPLVLAGLVAAGLAAAAIVAGHGGGGGTTGGAAGTLTVTRSAGPRTVTASGASVTVTQPPTTVLETVTAEAPPDAHGPTPGPPAGKDKGKAQGRGNGDAAATGGSTLALQGYSKMQQGDYAGAVPLLEQAAQQLEGTGSTAEAYNDYNLAFALTQTEGCSDRVLQLLDASEAIQGHRKEIDRLRRACR